MIKQCTDLGVNLTTAQDYVDTHQGLMTDLKVLSLPVDCSLINYPNTAVEVEE